MSRFHCIDILAILSGGSSIAAWQEQLDWTLKIVATLIAILAGLLSLAYHWRTRRRPRRPLD